MLIANQRQRVFGLDVVRAVAILSVLIAHYSMNFAPVWGLTSPQWLVGAGFYGVELFFALSGFLIGNILFDIADSGATADTLWRFWLRRWMRTLPCYWLVLVLSVYVAGLFGDHNYNLWQFVTLTQNLMTPYTVNFYGVSWSLVIEEWFYILFPLAMFGALAITPRKGALVAILAFLAIPIVGRHIGLHWFNLPWDAGLRKIVPLQLDPIAYGTLAAYLVRGRRISGRASLMLGCGGAAIVAVSWWLLVAKTSFGATDFWISNGRFISASVGSALLVVAFSNLARPRNVVAVPFEFLSKRSYTLYLVHLPAFGFVAYYLFRADALVWAPLFGTILGFAAAMALTRFVELPIMQMRPKQFAGRARPSQNGGLTEAAV